MGNSNKKPQDYDVVRTFKQDQWISLEKKPNYQIWENKNKRIRADVYPLNKQLKPIDLDHYEMRYNNSNDIVRVHNLGIQEESTLCSRSSKSNVFVERIPYRLNDVSELTQSEALSVLRSAFSGFNTLSTFYGPVEPYQDLICFNQDGKTKVWVNSNLSQNKITSERLDNPIGNFANLNAVYVNKLFDMVENKTQGGAFSPALKNRFRQYNPKTFFEALNLIQEYASEEKIQIPPTISPRTFSNFSNGSFILQNNSSQVNPYNSIRSSQGPQWNQAASQQTPFTLNAANSTQNLFNTPAPQQQNSYQVNGYPSYSQSQYFNNYGSKTSSPLQVGSALPAGQFSIVIPPVRPTTNTSPVLNNSFSNSSLMINPASPTKQFDPPTNVVSMQAIGKTANVENRTKSPIGSVANISEIKLSEQQPISQNIIQNQNPSFFKPQSPAVANEIGQQRKYFNQPTIIQGYPQLPSQFIQRPNYIVGPSNPQSIYSAQTPSRQLTGYSQPQFSPRVPQITFNNQQVVRTVEPQPRIVTQNQAQPQQVQTQVVPQVQVQAQVSSQGRAPSSERKPKPQQIQIKNQVIQNIQSRQLSHQSGSASQARSSEHREVENQQIKNNLSNNEENLANAYEEQNQQDNYGPDQQDAEDDQQFYDDDNDEGQQEDFREEGLIEGEPDQVQRELERLEQQKNQDHSKEQDVNDGYFPFAANFKAGQVDQIKRITTMEINQEQMHEANKSEENRQQNNQTLPNKQIDKVVSIDQSTQKLKQSTESKGKRVQIIEPERKQQQQIAVAQQQSPLAVKLQTQKSSQPPGSAQKKNNVVENSSGQNQASEIPTNQYQYQYKSSVPQSSQNEKFPEDARYEDIEQYIRNKYKSYIGAEQDNSDYRPSSSVYPYRNDVGRVGDVEMATYVQSKYNQFSSNQDVNFSFKPTSFQSASANQSYGEKPATGMISSYEYMRVQQMIGDPQQEKQHERKSLLMTDNKKSQKNGNEEDILDVKNMERSLDKKYSAMKSNQLMNIDMNKKQQNQEHQFDVKKLEENLIRFQESRVGSGQTNQVSNSAVNEPRFQTSQVSKIQSIDQILANRRRSSMNRGLDYNKDYKDQIGTNKLYSYENQSPVNQFGRKSRASKVSKQISDIDQKFNKYVKGGAAINTSSSSKLIAQPQSKQYAHDYRQQEQQESRNATGHFGYSENSRGWEEKKGYETTKTKTTKVNQVTNIAGTSKGPSYEDLRKFMWS